MKTEYAQAFLATIQEGVSLDTALSGLRGALERKGHGKLYAPVLFEVLRVLEAEKGTKTAEIRVAFEKDFVTHKSHIETALQTLGVSKDTPVRKVVDETIVGGFVATYDYKEHDQSYKKALKSLYESIVK